MKSLQKNWSNLQLKKRQDHVNTDWLCGEIQKTAKMKRKNWRNSLPKAPKLVISALDNPGVKVLKEGKATAGQRKHCFASASSEAQDVSIPRVPFCRPLLLSWSTSRRGYRRKERDGQQRTARARWCQLHALKMKNEVTWRTCSLCSAILSSTVPVPEDGKVTDVILFSTEDWKCPWSYFWQSAISSRQRGGSQD